MAAVRLCVTNLVRRRLGGLVAVALLVAVAGGVVLAAFAGARRTDTAFPRLLAQQRALDVIVSPGPDSAMVPASMLRRLPSVTAAGDGYGFGISQWNGRGPRPQGSPTSLQYFALGSMPGDGPVDAELPRVDVGRLPRPNRADELFLNNEAASLLGVNVGDTVHYTLYKFEELF